MIKVDKVMAQGFLLKERTARVEKHAHDGLASGDKVTISEEGKKRRIFGHVMASISGPDVKKKG